MTTSTLPTHRYSPKSNWMAPTGLLLTGNFFVLMLWHYGLVQAQENHVLELAQCAFLALACGVCSVRAWHLAKISLNLNFLLHAGLALLSYSFILREVDIDRLGTAPAWASLEQGLRLFGVALWLALLIFVVPRVRQLWAQRAIMFKKPMVILAMMGGALLLASWPFDKQVFTVLPYLTSQFIEELLELNGCMVLFFSSLSD